MASKQSKTSLVDLWEQAFNNYNQVVEKEGTKRNLRLRLDALKAGGLVQSIDDVKRAVDDSSKAFRKYRNSGSTVEKVREFIGDSLRFVSVVGDNVVAAASTAFPPAGAIWTVATFAIKACQAQSEDYDQLLALIGETGNLLKTIKIIETTLPDCESYTKFITEALTAIIGVFAVQTKLMLMKRPLVFLHTLVRGGGDGDLAEAYARVTEALTHLSGANQMIAIKNTEDIKTLVTQLGGDVNFYHENIMEKLANQANGIEMSYQAILVNQLGVEANQQGIEANHQLLAQMFKMMQSERPEKPKQTRSAEEIETNVLVPINRVNTYFEVDKDPELVRHDLARSHVPDSVAWLFETPRYQDWLSNNEPFLPFADEEGQGKSHVAYAVINHLEAQRELDSGTTIAYFWFQPESKDTTMLIHALCSIFIQISKQDRKFREKLAKGIQAAERIEDWIIITPLEFWKMFRFDKYYREEGNSKLYIVLDNADDFAAMEELLVLLARIARAARYGSRIKVFLTYSTRNEDEMQDITGPAMRISPEDRRRSKTEVLESRLDAMPRLSRFGTAAKRHILETLRDEKFSVLCATQVLQMLETKGVERLALKQLQKMPASINSLYDQTIANCLDGREGQSAEALSLILQWLSVCKDPFSLHELYALLQYQFGHRVLDIEDEISNKCASILKITSIEKKGKHAKQQLLSLLEQLTGKSTDDDSLGFNIASEKAIQSPGRMAHKLPFNQPLYSDDDSEFEVQLNGAAMARYMEGPSFGFNSKCFYGHLAAFTACVKILKTPINASDTPTPEGVLQKYAAENWDEHLHWLHLIDSSIACATTADVEIVAETLLGLHVDGKIAAENMFKQESNCCESIREHQREGLEIMKRWFSRYNPAETTDSALASNAALAKGLAQNPEQFFVPFVRWHAEIAVEQVRDDLVQEAFRQVYMAYWTTKPGEDSEETEWNIDDKHEKVLRHLGTDVIPQDYRFFRTAAVILVYISKEREAWTSISKSLELIELDQSLSQEHHGIEKFYTLYWAGKVFKDLDTDDYNPYWKQAAQMNRLESYEERVVTQDILDCMMDQINSGHDEDLEQAGLLIEELAGSPDPKGGWLGLYVEALQGNNLHKQVVEAVTRYGSLRLALSPNEDIHEDYQESAQKSGLVKEMLATYWDLISQLEPLRMASPTKYHLARAYRRIIKNEVEAKELLYQILDADNCFDPSIFRENEEVLLKAQMGLSEVIYNQFQASNALEEKRRLIREMESLVNRRLGQVGSVDSSHGTYSTLLARMYRKLGPCETFFEVLDADFKECMDKLSDEDPDNDGNTLRQLCKILACVPGLEKDAELALSASFYNIDPELSKDEPFDWVNYFGDGTDSEASDRDGEYNPEDAKASESNRDPPTEQPITSRDDFETKAIEQDGGSDPEDAETSEPGSDGEWTDEDDNESQAAEEDAPDIDLDCGSCRFYDWDNEPRLRFWCVICAETIICGECMEGQNATFTYCGSNHSHIKVPMDGWIAVKNGEIHIENNEPILCREWLRQLREEKWPRVWEQLLLG
ncbi:hypothetical protein G6514_010145 [Epicoccum nigrum]|nr:hypothetical protein G6514_010145 [Epicoccum nigrum]